MPCDATLHTSICVALVRIHGSGTDFQGPFKLEAVSTTNCPAPEGTRQETTTEFCIADGGCPKRRNRISGY